MKNFNEEWIELLTGGKLDKQLEFEEILANSKCEMLAIMKYRRLQMQEREQITLQDLKEVWNNNIELIKVLQEMFLEPIQDIKFIRDRVTDIDELYNRHTQDKNTRILSIVLTI